MSDESWSFGTLNAKRMTAAEVARSFVMPDIFHEIAGFDHCFVVGPRGSGKTTLLRMLHGESLSLWEGSRATEARERITYSGIFLPSDELWASQTSPEAARTAFAVQMLLGFLDTIDYRTGRRETRGLPIHLEAALDSVAESQFVRECATAWRVQPSSNTLLALQASLDLLLLHLATPGSSRVPMDNLGPLELLRFGVRSFNRLVGQPQHRWAVLLDELELAPRSIHNDVQRFVRGGSGELILKVSMSPFDRYMHSFVAGGGAPSPGNDFRAIYLSGQSRRDIYQFTEGLWKETLRQNGLAQVPISQAFGFTAADHSSGVVRGADRKEVQELFVRTQQSDPSFASWLRQRDIDATRLDRLSYVERSATVRKVYPLLVFRDALLTFRDGKPVRRPRKKSIEPFSGASAISAALEGNPRWIKNAFSEMVRAYDPAVRGVLRGFQLDSLKSVAHRFDALLHVLPRTETLKASVSIPALVDSIARYFNSQHLGAFTSDPQNCFTVDSNTPKEIVDALALALYAGAIVHVRDRRSSAVLHEFAGQRFRLAYLLAVRDGMEFPLRLGRDARLSRIIGNRSLRTGRRLPTEPKYRQEELDLR